VSRAFVRDSDGEPEPLPERAVSSHPNLVTPRGLEQIEAQVQELSAARAAARAAGDRDRLARIERDLRYWNARRASARLIEPGALAGAAEQVRFGMRVRLRLANGETSAFRLVGEDEADVAQGLLSYVAPLARALLGRRVGERVPFQGGEAEIESIEA
jgi:transcription elongation GreA/GreB family factor